MARAFIGIGSNIEPAKNVRAAIRSLAQKTRLKGISMVYRTDALGRPEQNPYFNCVVEIATEVPPEEMKYGLLRPIEHSLGRQRSEDKYAPRTIDLDLIAYDDLAMETEGITLPDPDILVRPFLAVPLFELAPDLVLAGQCIADIAAQMPQDGMKPLKEYALQLRAEARLGAADNCVDPA